MLRADHRLRGGENPQVGAGKIPRVRPYAGDADEVRGRSHGHRAHVQGGAAERHPLARDRPQTARASPGPERTDAAAGGPAPRQALGSVLRLPGRRERRGRGRTHSHRSVVPRPDPAARADRAGVEALRAFHGPTRRLARSQTHGLFGPATGRNLGRERRSRARTATRDRRPPGFQARGHLRRRIRILHALSLLEL